MYRSLLLIAVLLAGCSKDKAAEFKMPTVPVKAVSAEVKDVPQFVEAIGKLHPSVYMEVRPQVSGTIAKVMVKEGDFVEKDDPLFSINPIIYEIKVSQAKAQKENAEATLRTIEKKMERLQKLSNREYLSEMEWDELESALIQAKGAFALSKAALKMAELDLECCVITSPTEGRVGKCDIHPGKQVQNGQLEPLVMIADLDPLVVEFTLTEKELAMMGEGVNDVVIEPLVVRGKTYSGSISFLDNHFDQRSGQLLVRGSVENGSLSLRPGQSIRVKVPVAIAVDRTLIPQKAVKYNESGPYIYVVNENQMVELHSVVLGDETGDDVVVLEGIDAEQMVITEGHLRVFPGSMVEINS